MDNTIFAQSIARIRVYETRLLTRAKLEGMSEARDFDEAIRMLQDSIYGSYISMPSYEDGLKASLEELYRDMKKLVPVREVIDILSARYDAHNIKSLIKGKQSGVDVDSLLIDAGTIPLDNLKMMFRDEDYKEMPEILRGYVLKAFESYRNTEDPQEIDIIMDKGMYRYMLEIAKNSRLEYLNKIVKLMIDVTNIKAFIRVKAQERGIEFFERVYIEDGKLELDLFATNFNNPLDSFVKKVSFTQHDKWVREGIEEYEKTGDLGRIEKSGDNYIIDYLRSAKFVSFGPEPIIAYILARENEIKVLRIILTGKKNEVHPDIIRERLRDTYV